MRVRNQSVLEPFRRSLFCEWCKRPTPEGCDPAHAISRGAGGPDHPLNLISLCRGWWKGEWKSCHGENHAGRAPTQKQLFAVIARREGWPSGEAVRREVWRLIRERGKRCQAVKT